MRAIALLLPFALTATPALAAEPAAKGGQIQIPHELTDPATGEKLGRMAGVLARALMDMPVGELQAAVEGRDATAADRRRTVRDIAGGDRNLDHKVETQVAEAMPRLQAGMQAMAASLPAIMATLQQAAEQMEGTIDRARANLPDPTYPKR
ncbi:hypothetical protein [Sphingomonas alba]|uniref:Uncharacterized protein n=1 Tax=Sphingomonas alba TaxID=2908208 RepID=A0ABT0RLD9_9SPHN|nr:hypothetical protein [Sphingomonas alba]MCL6683461.1 hypothetical protein [Sphingomonas alba]